MIVMAMRGEFAALIRAWRDRLQPAAVGLPAGIRKTSGLRREEVAMLAGLSVDYVVRLEQGRADHPSEQVVAALARVLQLSGAERDELYRAAGLTPPSPAAVPRHIPGSVQRLLARLPDVGVGVWTAHWTLLSANDSWTALLGEMTPGRNLVYEQFLGTTVPVLMTEPEVATHERALVSDLRAALRRYPRDPDVRRLVDRLSASDRFTRMWESGVVSEHASKRKTFVHPLVGTVTLDCDVFTATGTDLRIVTYTAAPGTDDESRFNLIRTLRTTTR